MNSSILDQSTASNTSSIKRKSFDDENCNTSNYRDDSSLVENCNKKLKSSTFKSDGNSCTTESVKSSLPRFSRKVSTSIIPKVVKSTTIVPNREKNLNAVNDCGATAAAAAATSSIVANRTPPRNVLSPKRPNTASKQISCISQTPRISTNPFLRKMQREVLNDITGNYFSNLFDSHITNFHLEDKITGIMNSLKIKAKWDIKEKSKKQEQVIKELRDLLINVHDSVHSIKNQSVSFEEKLVNSIRESYDQVVDDIQIIATLQSNDKKLRKEFEMLQNEKSILNQKHEDLKFEHANQIKHLETSSLLNAKENERLKEKLSESQANFEKSKIRYEEMLQDLKANQEKYAEEVSKVHLVELTALKSTHSILQDQFKKLQQDFSDLQQQHSSLSACLHKKNTEQHDASVQNEVLIRENTRVIDEIKTLKDSLKEKDDDMRRNTASHYDMLKQSMEEKNSLWNELSQVNSKLSCLEDERRALTNNLSGIKEENALLNKDKQTLQEHKHVLETQISQLEDQLFSVKDISIQLETERNLKSYFEMQNEQEKRERIAATAQFLAVQNELQKKLIDAEHELKSVTQAKNSSLNSLKDEVTVLSAVKKDQEETIFGLREEIASLHSVLKEKQQFAEKFQGISVESARNLEHILADKEKSYITAVEELSYCRGELEKLKSKLNDSLASNEVTVQDERRKIHELEEKLQVSEQTRRKLFNVIQELRGNIRVFARVRPFLPNDFPSGADQFPYPEGAILPRADLNILKIKRSSNIENKRDKEESFDFSFDRVFGPSMSQESIFQEVSEFVQSALDGYQVCLFSYGQTGSGKTHTMNGSGGGDMRGIIPRAMEQVAQYKKELEQKGWKYSMEISFIEIYNENIRDLLRSATFATNGNITTTNLNSNNSLNDLKHEIKKDANGSVYVSDINKICVDPDDFESISKILEIAATQRSVSSTLMNDTSSRSHAIFTLHLHAVNKVQHIELNGSLNLVDLAGSERIDKSGVGGQELKEAVAINKSLSSLADVFSSIANKSSHIPFRNSKLTYLLQPALSGDGKTLMIVNLSPTETSFHESLSSLRFANQVSQCELGKPKRKLKEITASSEESEKGLSKTASLALPTPVAMGNLSIEQAKSLSCSLGAKTPTSTTPLLTNNSKSVVKSSSAATASAGSKFKPTLGNSLRGGVSSNSSSKANNSTSRTPMK